MPETPTLNQQPPQTLWLPEDYPVDSALLPPDSGRLIIVGDAQAGKSTVMDAIVDAVNTQAGQKAWDRYEHSWLLRAVAYLAGESEHYNPNDPAGTAEAFAPTIATTDEREITQLTATLDPIIAKGDETLRSEKAGELVAHISEIESIRELVGLIGTEKLKAMGHEGMRYAAINGRNIEHLGKIATAAGLTRHLGSIILECDPLVAARRKKPDASREEQQALAAEIDARNRRDRKRDHDPATTRESMGNNILAVVDELPDDSLKIRHFAWELGYEMAAKPFHAVVIGTDKINLKPERQFVTALAIAALNGAAEAA